LIDSSDAEKRFYPAFTAGFFCLAESGEVIARSLLIPPAALCSRSVIVCSGHNVLSKLCVAGGRPARWLLQSILKLFSRELYSDPVQPYHSPPVNPDSEPSAQ
jgi:hypothetical protein